MTWAIRVCLSLLISAALAVACDGARAASDAMPPLTLETTIPLDGVRGRIDHMALDRARRRLIVAELGNGSADVVDLVEGKIVHRITGLREPQGIGYAEAADLIFIANAGDGTVRIFQGADFASAGTVPLGSDADDVRIDPRDGSVVVGYGDGGLAVIDPGRRRQLEDIQLPAHPEGFEIDSVRGRAFVNVPDARQIAVVDLGRHRIVDAWRLPDARANFPMALDVASGLLAAGFRSPPRLILLDSMTGAIRRQANACGDADDVFFDDRRHRVYLSCGSGEIDSFQLGRAGIRMLPAVRTAPGARTSLFVPQLDRLFVAKREDGPGQGAALLVFRPSD